MLIGLNHDNVLRAMPLYYFCQAELRLTEIKVMTIADQRYQDNFTFTFKQKHRNGASNIVKA